jgi:hypothetical protein
MTIQYSGYALTLVPEAVEVTGKRTAPVRNSILSISGFKFNTARKIARKKIQELNPTGFIHEHRVTQYLSVFTTGASHGVDKMYTLAPHEHSHKV